MPRSQMSPAGRVVEFFRTAPLEIASLVLGLCQDALHGRQMKSEKAKTRTATVGGPAPLVGATTAPAPRAGKPAKRPYTGKKRGRKPKAPVSGETEVGLPLESEYGEAEAEDLEPVSV